MPAYRSSPVLEHQQSVNMKNTYHQVPNLILILLLIGSCYFSIQMFSTWKNSGGWYYLPFALFFLVSFLACARPVLDNRRIIVENDSVIILKRFYKPIRVSISKDLYKVVIKDDTVRSFRFNVDDKYVQVSPIIYQNGEELSDEIIKYMKKKKIVVEMVSALL
ncbi:MAG: hypothetical protein U9R57_14710 [Thermodesulfobacteriota bacterium]|nr:hypothetical protein [Thermodesulfobacteriota bacterium]